MEKFFQTDDGDNFRLTRVGKKLDILPPGVYLPFEVPGELFFRRQVFNTDELIQIEDDLLSLCINEIEKFWTKKKIFKEHNFPFKRGILLYGPPGSGKTCALKLIANNIIKKDGIVLQFGYSGTFLRAMQILREVQPEIPIIALMEDIDTLLLADEAAITNILDGFNHIENILFLATTNDINNISERIRNRPSRFDKCILVNPPSEKVRKFYLENIAKLSSNPITIPDQWVEDTKDMSFAQLKELYIGVHILECPYDETLIRLKNMTPEISNYALKRKRNPGPPKMGLPEPPNSIGLPLPVELIATSYDASSGQQ